MQVQDWRLQAVRKLKDAGIASANLDVLILLEDALKKDRTWILAHPETVLQGPSLQKLGKQIARRNNHEPLAYIRSKTEFYGREFFINKDILEPRPESETMISLLCKLVDSTQLTVDRNFLKIQPQRLDGVQGDKGVTFDKPGEAGLSKSQLTTSGEQRTEPYLRYGEGAAQTATQQSAKSTGGATLPWRGGQAGAALTVVDVGTGSGALAVTAKLELPEAEVIATDIDPSCLKVARKNAKNHGVKIKFFQGDLLQPLLAVSCQLSAVLANLPYVPDDFTINQAAANEPKIAIFGGPDGLDLYRRMFAQSALQKQKPQFIFTESLPPQHKKLAKIARKTGYKLAKTEDFIQVFELKS